MSRTDFIPYPKFEDYKETFKQHFIMDKREDGVLCAKMTMNGEENTLWSEELHRAIWQMWQTVGADPTVELVIFGGSGNNFLMGMDDDSWLDEVVEPAAARYNHMYYDGRRMLLSMMNNVEVPTIGVINGTGGHMELALMCDLCIMADDAIIIDPHFRGDIAPGDGIQFCLRELMGIRRSTYMMYTCQNIDAELAMRYNLVDEVVPKDKVYERAYELADIIMARPRPTRRLTSSILKHHWREVVADELDGAFGTEMFGDFCHDVAHAASKTEDYAFQDDPNVATQAVDEELDAIRKKALEYQKAGKFSL